MKKIDEKELDILIEDISEGIIKDIGGGCCTHRDFVGLAADVSGKMIKELFKRLQEEDKA